ncbi:MAG TPA: hypothetical protein VHF89_02295 [Solirubrobacteraceae bacterium]|nr:hypothetical protein [Solirubrobacteraceae bacterium]
MVLSSLLAATEPAGGAATDQVVIATAGATLATAALLWLVAGHRSGRVKLLGAVADRVSRTTALAGWSALPAALAGAALGIALLGMYWDIALHIDEGRDAGPLANPAHYLILAGLFGVFAAGVIAMALPRPGERPGPAPLRIARDWHAPIGGVLMAACGAFALIGFPLDDVWHRLFGQDVTLWGPTHLMLIGGAGMTLIANAVLLGEAMHDKRRAGRREPEALVTFLRRSALMGGLLIGLSTFQAEFDFGVPQYRMVFQPFLIALAAGFALVAARIWIGRGGALLAVAFYVVVRGGVSVIVGPVLGQTTPAIPLYVAEAVVVEAVALLAAARARPLLFGVTSGVLVGTLGFAAEWAWVGAVFRLEWTGDVLAEGLPMAVAGGVAGGLAGALLAAGLRRELPPAARPALALALALVAACLVNGLVTTGPGDARAVATVEQAGDGRVDVTARVTPPPSEPAWLTVTSWQGGGLVVEPLREVSRGVYRTEAPVPASGEWKATIRFHDGRRVLGAPLYLPRDTAIPAPEVPATARFDRAFLRDHELLQRERKDDTPGWLWTAAGALVLALYLAFLGALAWGVGRVARRGGEDDAAPPREPGARPVGRRAPVPA